MNFQDTIAETLKRVKTLLDKRGGSHILHTSEIQRGDRELLLRTRWLEEISRGWYLLTRPDSAVGDSTAWYASFWDFLKTYLEHHHGKDYCLSAECSIDLYLGDLVVPTQMIVIAKKGSGIPLSLPYETSLLVYADADRLPEQKENIQGIMVMPLSCALCRVNPNYFIRSPIKAESALRGLQDVSGLLDEIVKYNRKTAAERLVGAYRFLGMEKMATALEEGLSTVGMSIKENNPFNLETPLIITKPARTPHALRIQTMWAAYGSKIENMFSEVSITRVDPENYLDQMQELYVRDAYNSLSIEGYQVTPELIKKVQEGLWDPQQNFQDRDQQNALAARGYYEAFQKVKTSIARILKGWSAGEIIQEDLPVWFQSLFAPSVRMGILQPSDLYGWRRHQVYIRGSRHTPMSNQYLMDAMETFFQCLNMEQHPGVRAVLGHFIFVYIHPYMDGNGRIARFLMNTQLASGGYPWIVIPVEKRTTYFAALEAASAGGDIRPFTQFIVDLLPIDRARNSLE